MKDQEQQKFYGIAAKGILPKTIYYSSYTVHHTNE
jgi:hypothetical protein